MVNSLKSLCSIKNILLLGIIAVIIISNFYLIAKVGFYVKNSDVIYYEPGEQYRVFKPYTYGTKEVGFLSNRVMTPESGQEDYLQAQYMLAPTILTLNDSENRLNILDYTEDHLIGLALKRFDLKAITDNKYRRVLAVKAP